MRCTGLMNLEVNVIVCLGRVNFIIWFCFKPDFYNGVIGIYPRLLQKFMVPLANQKKNNHYGCSKFIIINVLLEESVKGVQKTVIQEVIGDVITDSFKFIDSVAHDHTATDCFDHIDIIITVTKSVTV